MPIREISFEPHRNSIMNKHTANHRPPRLRRKKLCSAISALLCPAMLLAAPLDGVVKSGTATIASTGAATTIEQSSAKAIIEWKQFGIRAGESVEFKSAADAITLNRVIGTERSVIDGAMKASGKVFLVNANGVVFGKTASVATGGLVASALAIQDADFTADKFSFQGNGKGGTVSNAGKLTTGAGGYVALLGRTVANSGTIGAPQGGVALASGEKITLGIAGGSLLSIRVDEGTLKALIDNSGNITADGGQIYLDARAAGQLLDSQVNSSGIVQARTLADLKGNIAVNAYNGTVNLGGTLDASAPSAGDGGNIATAGGKVKLANGGTITTRSAAGVTGAWTVHANGISVGNAGDISATALGKALDNSNVALNAETGNKVQGDIAVNGAVGWGADTKLELNAGNNIGVNAAITAGGKQAGMELKAGSDYRIDMKQGGAINLPGEHARLRIQDQDYTLLHSLAELDAIDDNADRRAGGFYALADNMSAPPTPYAGPLIARLSGTLAGLGHSIDNLAIAANVDDGAGAIGKIDAGAAVRDLGLSNIAYTGGAISGLAYENRGKLSNVYTSGTVAGSYNLGGLVGLNYGTVADSYSGVAVNGASNFGGLAGRNDGSIERSYASGAVSANGASPATIGGLVGSNRGSIAFSHATGNVTVLADGLGSAIGGLVGSNTGSKINKGSISDSYATGKVQARNGVDVGGLVGSSFDGAISRVSASGDVTVDWTALKNGQNAGGLIGKNSGTPVSYAQASGNVTVNVANAAYGYGHVGGLIGINTSSYASYGVISHVSASGNVTANGSVDVGGLIGQNFGGPSGGGNVSDAHASGNVSGAVTTGGLVGANYGQVSGSSASGSVASTLNGTAGGLLGSNYASGNVSNSTASGNVAGSRDVGGLAGSNDGNISGSAATGSVSGSGPHSGGGIGNDLGTGSGNTYNDAAAAAAQAAADAAADAAARAAADAAARAAADAAARAAADAAARAAADAAAKAAADAAARAAADAAAKAAADAAAKAAADAAAKAAADAAARAAADAAAKAAADAAARAAADAAAKAAADAAAKAAADAAAKAAADAAARAAADAATKASADAAAKAAAEAAQRATSAANDAQQQVRAANASAATSNAPASNAPAGQARARGVGNFAPANHADTAPAPIVFVDKRSFSTSIRQVELDGEVFDLESDKQK
jgi:filamentous hemagglutinin family protein